MLVVASGQQNPSQPPLPESVVREEAGEILEPLSISSLRIFQSCSCRENGFKGISCDEGGIHRYYPALAATL
jgi:hypothetical protein